MKKDFWKKAHKCKHKNLSPNYCEPSHCLCNGYEIHCLDCKAYISVCKCGEQSGMSGWPAKRWTKKIVGYWLNLKKGKRK